MKGFVIYLLLMTPSHNLVIGKYHTMDECNNAKMVVKLSTKKRGTYFPDFVCYHSRVMK